MAAQEKKKREKVEQLRIMFFHIPFTLIARFIYTTIIRAVPNNSAQVYKTLQVTSNKRLKDPSLVADVAATHILT